MWKDIWKWIILANPALYFLGKFLGGEAEKGADEAARIFVTVAPLAVVIAIVLVIYFLFVK